MDKILFLRLRLLGDIIFTIPALQIFREHFPQCKIYYLVEERFTQVAELIPGVHKVIVVPYKMALKDLLHFRKEIKKLRFDTALDFHSGPKSALLTYLSGAKKRIGYKSINRSWAYTHLTPRKLTGPPIHSVFHQARFLRHLGIPLSEDSIPPYPEIENNRISRGTASPPSEGPGEQAAHHFDREDSLFSKLSPGISKEAAGKEHKIVVHVGAGNKFRDWGIENFAALFKKIKAFRRGGIGIFLIGHSKEERRKAALLEKECDIYNFTGKLTIREALYLIEKSAVYLGVDSGPLHLASLTRTPLVALYGPNIPAVSGPWRKKEVHIIQSELECRPCSQRNCIYDTIRCMKNIKTDEVYETIIKFFQ